MSFAREMSEFLRASELTESTTVSRSLVKGTGCWAVIRDTIPPLPDGRGGGPEGHHRPPVRPRPATAETSASLFQDDMIVRVPLVLNVALAGRAKGERSTRSS